jgi:hypothetical protein
MGAAHDLQRDLPAPLSLDLRSRVIAAWPSGEHGSWEELAATFRIDRATVNRLIRRF